ncbi:MAG: HD domain-containing protein [Geobacteraceae bacterium]|nr:HD domain-containing protein [Geobacteraceae bacterium]
MKRAASFIHSRVARRIFVLFIICALLPVCVLALLSLQRVSSRLEADSQEHLRIVAKNAGMAVFGGLDLLQAELESMSLPSGDETGRMSRRPGRSEEGKQFLTVTVTKDDTERGTIPGMSVRLPPAAHAHLAGGKALILAATDLGAGDPIHMVTSANPNLPRHELLVGEINAGYLWTIAGYTQPPGIDLCILGPTGKTLYATQPLNPALVSLVMSHQKRTSIGQLKWQGGNGDYLVNYWSAFMKPAFMSDSWTIVAFQSRQDSLGPARSFITTFLLVISLTLFVVIFASSILIRRSLVPLSILNEGARCLSRGDFNSKVEIASGDEFEDLAASFNYMSEQLGDQFTRLSDMGKLFQKILEARDQDTIINEVMFHYSNSVAYEWIGISLLDANTTFQVQTSYSSKSNGIPAKTVQFEVLLSREELKSLWVASEGLHIMAGQAFVDLLAPMAAEGAGEFFLQPILIKNNLVGVLILGYHQAPNQYREELVRFRQVADEIAIALDNIRLIEELNGLNRGTIEVLANAVDAKSPWTAGHSQRVTSLALEIGKEMGLSASGLETLQLGGLFHDIGKIGIPELILDKPGRLTEEEYAIIRDHPRKGAEMLKPIRAYHEAIPIVSQHHEQFDGRGYPRGLAGEEIVLGARILAVADVFDALFSKRPYRQGWGLSQAISYLEENAGSSFDPGVVAAFLKIDLTTYFELASEADRPDPDRSRG